MRFLIIFFISALTAGFTSFAQTFDIKEFNPLLNFNNNADTLYLPMDLTEVITDGISIPSKNQSQSGYFHLSFRILNRSDRPQSFYYKIFYQNETYKFAESVNGVYNILASDNFYGSWNTAADSFHETPVIPCDNQYHTVTDSFRILGNPRDEEKYFGAETLNYRLLNESINHTKNVIMNDNVWFQSIKDKAQKNGISVEDQLQKDALWAIQKDNSAGNVNNRWKRNPYVGAYSFLLTITSKENIGKIPESIKDISQSAGGYFTNPYYYFNSGEDLFNKFQLVLIQSKKVLKTSAEFNLGSGIFIPNSNYLTANPDTSYYSVNCNSSDLLFMSAQFEQYFHNINNSNRYNNIPVISDVTGENYSRNTYYKNTSVFSSKELINDCPQITDNPGKTVQSDIVNKRLMMKNPGNSSQSYRKENVGINSRIGFTYGKYIAKIKFPAIISSENVWNGLTCAYWLKFQAEEEWNNRMECRPVSLGYLSKSCEGSDCQRIKTTYYSEIDFEILKTSEYWPKTSYPINSVIPHDNPAENHNIIITCTNWDLACRLPKRYGVGARKFVTEGKTFTVHRWDDWYKALTIKSAINHDSILNRAYYYEIDWQPDKIIWRIGPNRNEMMVVGYMDNTITTIPNNQMIVVFSQEFHDSKWWPLSPFLQEMIPYPKNDIKGEILELKVE